MSSENGWEPAWVGEDRLNWVDVPGCDVRVQTQKGQPTAILRAWIADHNAYIEPVRDRDTASYTPTNSVSTSNHLNGTAADINWDSHPFHVRGTFNADQMRTLREMLEFYEGTIFWAGDWNDPIDEMHVQLGYDTYNNPHTQDFINRKIRADGFSTFRRSGEVPAPTVLTVPLIQKVDGTWTSPSPAWAHLIMRESSGNPTIIQQIIDVNSGGNEAEGLFQITPKTWRAHQGDEFAASPRLATPQQQAIVAARIFTKNPSGSDWGAGIPGRENAAELAAGLVPIASNTDPILELLMSDLSVESLSIYATPGEPLIPIVRLLQSIDAADHRELVENAARLGDRDSLDRIARTAAGKGKFKDPATVAHAQAVLADIEANNPKILKDYLAAKGA